MEIKARIAFILCLLVSLNFSANAEVSLWQDIKPLAAKSIKSKKNQPEATPKIAYQNARLLHLDVDKMTAELNTIDTKVLAAKSQRAFDSKQKSASKSIDLPLPDGRLIRVSISHNKLLPSNLLSHFPNIKMLDILPDDFIVSGKLDITTSGFHAMLQTREGETIFIDPVSDNIYASYQKSDQRIDCDTVFSCTAHSQEELLKKSQRSIVLGAKKRNQKSLINYRIAIAATGEYTAKHGGTVAGAMSAIATTINRVNQVFEQDLGIHLSLVENNDKLIYVDANTDPYFGSDSKEHLYQNQNNIPLPLYRQRMRSFPVEFSWPVLFPEKLFARYSNPGRKS